MPAISHYYSRKQLRPLYFSILDHLAKKYPGQIDKIFDSITKKEVNARISRSKSQKLISEVSKECGWKQDKKGGRFYDLYLFMRPKVTLESIVPDWKSINDEMPMSKLTVIGLFSYLEKNDLTKSVNTESYANYKSSFLDKFSSQSKIIRKSNYNEINKRALQNYTTAPTSRAFPETWKNSQFLAYERTDAGICISNVKFEEQGETEFVTFNTKYLYGKDHYDFSYNGVAYKDYGGDYIIVNCFRNEEPSTYASFIMRLDKDNERAQEISVGLYSYYAIRFRRYITKRVVWVKLTDDHKLDTSVREVPRTNLTEYNKIDELIRRFLHDENKNRLTLPEPIATKMRGEEASLERFIINDLSPSEKDLNIQNLRGEYFLFFHQGEPGKKTNDKSLMIVPLSIKPEKPSLPALICDSVCEFTHHEIERSGIVYMDDHTIYINLKQSESEQLAVKHSRQYYTSMMIQLPTVKEKNTTQTISENSNILFGQMIGLADARTKSASYKICLIRQEHYNGKHQKALRAEVLRLLG